MGSPGSPGANLPWISPRRGFALAASLLENMLPNSGLGRVGNKPPGKDVLRLEGINTLAPVVFRFS